VTEKILWITIFINTQFIHPTSIIVLVLAAAASDSSGTMTEFTLSFVDVHRKSIRYLDDPSTFSFLETLYGNNSGLSD